MSSSEPTPSPGAEPVLPESDHAAGPPPTGGATSATYRSTAIWALALAAALVACLASWVNGEKYFEYFKVSEEAARQPYDFGPLNREKAVADARNTAIAYGFLGGSLGICLGLAGGLSRRSIGAGLFAAVVGAILGTAAGVGGSYALTPVFRKYLDPADPNLLLSFSVHGGIWAAIGAAAGMALGLGVGGWDRIPRGLLGGLVGGLVGTVLFEVIHATAFPLVRANDVVPETSITRVLVHVLVAFGVAIGATLMAGSSMRHRSQDLKAT
jgi:hypothetical protein